MGRDPPVTTASTTEITTKIAATPLLDTEPKQEEMTKDTAKVEETFTATTKSPTASSSGTLTPSLNPRAPMNVPQQVNTAAQQQATPEKLAHVFNSTCIFVVAAPGSGSSTMVELIGRHCMKQQQQQDSNNNTDNKETCTMSGENWAAITALANFHSLVAKTARQWRGNEHMEAAWRRHFEVPTVTRAERDLVASLLNPQGNTCWGFKEIRFGRTEEKEVTFVRDMQYLTSLCARPKIILHSRRNATLEFDSTVLKNRLEQRPITLRQHECFDTFANLINSTAPNCMSTGKVPPKLYFRHYLEDYLERNQSFLNLWKFLGCTAPIPTVVVKKTWPKKDKKGPA